MLGAFSLVDPVGDPLRRGRARDDRAPRLRLAVVGERGLVHVEARPRVLARGALDGPSSACGPGPIRCSPARRRPRRVPSGRCACPRSCSPSSARTSSTTASRARAAAAPASSARVVLLTMPGYALLSHQAMTDMPLVASVAASLGFLLRALETRDEAQVSRWSVRLGSRALTLHAGHAHGARAARVHAPAARDPRSRGHVHLDAGGLHFGADRLLAGSPHACTLPGQPACAARRARAPAAPAARCRSRSGRRSSSGSPRARERDARRSPLRDRCVDRRRARRDGEGPRWPRRPGRRGDRALAAHGATLRDRCSGSRSSTGLAVAVVLVAPWYLAVFARHGRVFIDELVMRHMLGRTLDHLHDTNGAEDVGIVYFVRQLGYATFPWSGIALVGRARDAVADDGRSRRGRARALLFGGTLFAFALVSSMRTKFHHYGLVALPGARCSRACGSTSDSPRPRRGAAALTPRRERRRVRRSGARRAPRGARPRLRRTVRAVGAARFIRLMTYRYDRRWPSTEAFTPALGACRRRRSARCAALAVATLARTSRRSRSADAPSSSRRLLLDGYLVRASSDGGQRGVYEAYYRSRSASRRRRSSPTSSTGRARTSTPATTSRSSSRAARRCARTSTLEGGAARAPCTS